MSKTAIAKSVGKNGANLPIDVALIQSLLKNYFTTQKKTKREIIITDTDYSTIVINGKASDTLNKAIHHFQKNTLETDKPDSRIDPDGTTFRKLLSLQPIKAASAYSAIFGTSPIHTGMLASIPTAHMRSYFLKYYGLAISKGEDFSGFFELLKKDSDIKDIRWAAYILATVYHETTFSFEPRKENGKGTGYDYGKKVSVTDTNGVRGKPGGKYENIYYGRGYVQLTWDYNYKNLGKVIGLGDRLYINPDLALDKKTAYKITSYGMRNGSFTGDKLSDHISAGKTDYKNARKVINGTDESLKIAEYATTIEMLLRLSAQSAASLINK